MASAVRGDELQVPPAAEKLLYLVKAGFERPHPPIPRTIELPNSQVIVSAPSPLFAAVTPG
jgi:hypothetical protein